jgi:hypothetical protein
LRADVAAGAGFVFYDHGLIQILRQISSDLSSRNIRDPTWWKRHNERDGFIGIVSLRQGRQGRTAKRSDCQNRLVVESHFVSRLFLWLYGRITTNAVTDMRLASR